jgi:hypothetical protein
MIDQRMEPSAGAREAARRLAIERHVGAGRGTGGGRLQAALSMNAAAETLRRRAARARFLALAFADHAAHLEERAGAIEARAEALARGPLDA